MVEKDISWVKKEYEKTKQKYNLPAFEEMNSEFEIERLQERETELFVRILRRCIIDKVLNNVKLLEMLINPQSAPIFIHTLLSGLSADAKKLIEKLYEQECKIEMRSFALNNSSTEKDEIAFIKEILEKWPAIKKDIIKLDMEIKGAWGSKEESKSKGKGLVG